MSSRTKRVQQQITEQRVLTVLQVLSIMQTEAEKMSWWQRFKLANSNKETDNGREVQDTGKES